jgi:tRNA (adenine22-N1)-methyltransferase
MMKLELSPRLAAVASQIPAGARLADIGTDHAYLPVSLLLEGRIACAIAADIRQGPLDHARRTAQAYHMDGHLTFRLCDGLADIRPEECDTIAIAGMGGETIAHILSQADWARDGHLLILQPQSTQDILRHFLADYGWQILSERVVSEGERWYPILTVRGGVMQPLSPGEALAGRMDTWQPEPQRAGYLRWLLHRTQTQLAGLSRSARAEDTPRRERLLAAQQFLEQALEQLS